MQNIVWKRRDGGISITHIIDDIDAQNHAMELLDRAIEEESKTGVRNEILDWELLGVNMAVPEDRTFRNAWDSVDGSINVDIDKAVEIQKDKIRIERAVELTRLDTDYMRADEQGDSVKKTSIAAEKQKLRDMTKHRAFLEVSNTEELKNLTFENLKKE